MDDPQTDTMSLQAVCAKQHVIARNEVTKQSPSDAGRLLSFAELRTGCSARNDINAACNDIKPADTAQDLIPDDTPSGEVRPEDLGQDVALLRQNFRHLAQKTLSQCDSADYPRLVSALANVAGKLAQLVRVQIDLQVARGQNPTDSFQGLSAEVLAEIQRESTYLQLIMRLPEQMPEQPPEHSLAQATEQSLAQATEQMPEQPPAPAPQPES